MECCDESRKSMIENVLILQLVSTLAMTGIIWFVQIVHYPLFGKVGATSFHAYEQSHLHRTTIVVAPLMLTEAITALVLLWICPITIPLEAVVAGLLLVLLVWASTFFTQVPIHGKLSKSFDAVTHRRLVQWNWVRTIGWSARSVLICWICVYR